MGRDRFSQIPGLGRPEDQDEMSMGDRAMDLLERPGRATRAGISAMQNDSDPLAAAKMQLMGGSERPEAPTGADIAEKFGEDYDVQNPYALAGLATLADVADPSMLIPGGGQAGALGKAALAAGAFSKAGKAGKAVSRIGKTPVQARNTAELLKVRDILSNPKYGDLPAVQNALRKTGKVEKSDVIQSGEKTLGAAESDDLASKILKVLEDKGMKND